MASLNAVRTDAPAEGKKRRTGGMAVELALLCAGSVALAVAMTWPTMADPAATLPGDLTDPPLFAWILAWYGHALFHQPGDLFDANMYWPLAHTGMFADPLLGLAPLGIGVSDMGDALVRYNVAYVLAFAFNLVGAYVLARQLGSGRTGALVAGAVFAYTPWRICHTIHLDLLMTGAIPLSIALLLRGHGLGRGKWDLSRSRPWCALAGWAAATWQISLGFGIGLSFVYALLLIVAAGVVAWLVAGRPRLPRRLLAANVAGGAVFSAVTLTLGVMLLRMSKDFPESTVFRGKEFLTWFSPPIRALWTADANAFLWGPLTDGPRTGFGWPIELCLFPGLIVVLLALTGLGVTVWSRRRRVWLGLIVAVTIVLALGTTFFGGELTWIPVQHVLPGLQAMRTPGRLLLYTVLALGLLAAGAVTRLAGRDWLRPLLLVLPVLVCVEGVSTVPHPRVPRPPSALAHVKGPVLLLPSAMGRDPLPPLWSTNGFYRQVNGYGAFTPMHTKRTMWMTRWFPNWQSIEYLRSEGVREVVIPRDWAMGTRFEVTADTSVTGLPVDRYDLGDSVLFVLR